MPLSWTQNRAEQVRHFRGWNYVAIRAIAKMIAGATPQVGVIRGGDDLLVRQEKGAKFLTKTARRKALTSAQEHEEIEPLPNSHRLVKLLHNPNPPQVAWSFWYSLVVFKRLTGNGYVWAVPDGLGLPCELWVIPSHWVHPIGNPAAPDCYEIRPYTLRYGSRTFQIPGEEVIHIPDPGPLDPFDGYSAQSAGAGWIDTSESIDISRFATFKNGIHGQLIVEFDKALHDTMDEVTLNRFMSRLNQKYGGEGNAGLAIGLHPGATLKPLKQTPTEMDYVASGDQMRDWVMALHGVSKSIVGIMEDVNRASADAAIANFVFREITPELMYLGQVLTEKLGKRFDERIEIYWPDLTPDDPEMQLKKVQIGITSMAISRNEIREFIGLEPWPDGGDEPLGPMGQVPYPAKMQQPMGGLPMPVRYQGGQQGQVQPVEANGDGGHADVLEMAMAGLDEGQTSDPLGVQSPAVNRIKVGMNGHAKRKVKN